MKSKSRKNPHAVALGRRGGKSRSRAKILAARKNGKLGGRPRLDACPPGWSISDLKNKLRKK